MRIASNAIVAWSVAALAVVAAVLGWTRPPTEVERIVDRVVDREVEVERVVYRDRDVIRHVKVTEPGGTVTEVVEKTVDRVVEKAVEVEVEKVVSKDRVVERTRQPDWRVSGLVGLDAPLRGSFAPVYGLQVERRIIGPMSVGAWGLSSGTAGLSIGVAF